MDRSEAVENEEQLYLLEVMVNRLSVTKEGILDSISEADAGLDGSKPKKKLQDGPVMVKVKFFDFPTIEIEEEEFKGNENPPSQRFSTKGDAFLEDAKKEEERWRAKNAGMSVEMWKDEQERDRKLATEIAETLPPGNRFTMGKSCLFPMTPTEMIKTIQKYPLEAQVIRMSSNKCPSHVIGQAKINLGANFKEAITLATTPVVLPVSAYIEDNFPLANVFGDNTGDVSLFVRLSCFGTPIFKQYKYIQGEKGLRSKISEMGRGKKSLADYKKMEEEDKKTTDEKRSPCLSFDESMQGLGAQVMDDFSVPVTWGNINEPRQRFQFCSPHAFSREPVYQDNKAFKCALANNESVNLNRMFPGISHNVSKYKCPEGFMNNCPCPSSKHNDPNYKQKCGSFYNDKNKNIFKKTNASPNLRSVDYTVASENFETIDDNPTSTYKEISDFVDSDWELMVSGPSNRNPKRPAYPGKTNYQRFQKAPNPCPATADGNCRCSEGYQQKKPHTTECPERRFPSPDSTKKPAGAMNPCGGLSETGAILAGLPRLCDPIMQNMSNTLPHNLVVPQSATGSNVISICTCPKVPDFIPPSEIRSPADGMNIRCECSNILTSVHPTKVPYTCPGAFPQPYPKSDMIKGQVAPCPIKIPEQEAQQKTQTTLPAKPPCAESLPSLILSDDSTSEDDYHYIEQKRHLKAKGGKKKKESDNESIPPAPKKSKKMSLTSSAYGSSDRVEFDSTAHKILEEELDFYESMVDEVKNKAKGGSDSKSLKTKKDGISTSSVIKEKPKNDDDKKDNTLYRYTAGMYPGVHIGHKECVIPYRLVPKNMGWLWNIKSAAGFLKAGRGWRPGAIAESVAELMDAAKSSTYKAKKKSRKPQQKDKKKKETSELKHPGKKTTKMLKEERKDKDDAEKAPEDPRPTLHVHKKHGLYYVSMFPPKKEDDTIPHPIQFKIDPKHPDGQGGDSSIYETEDTSTNSEDSFQLEFVAPHTLKGRTPAKTKIDMQCQVSSDHMVVVPTTPSVVKVKTPKGKKGKGKKGKGKKGKGKKGRAKKSKKITRK